MTPDDAALTPVRVWDLPTRLFHWLLAAAIVASVASAKIGGNAMVWHMRCGYLVFTLLAFRLVWGFVGARWSRFASFVPTPGRIARYLRGQPRPGEWLDVGHNPLGSLSVLAILVLLALQVGTGLVADDEIATTGPLNGLVSAATASRATHWHKDYGQFLIIALVVLHVAAIIYHATIKKNNLVWPMLHGDKRLPAQVPESLDSGATRGAALVVAAACGAVVAWVVSLGS